MSLKASKSYRRVCAIHDHELNKPAEKMDTDLLWECLQFLHLNYELEAQQMDESWEALRLRIEGINLEEVIHHEPKRTNPRRRIPRASLVAMVLLVIMLLVATIVHALGFNVWQYFVHWTEDRFNVNVQLESTDASTHGDGADGGDAIGTKLLDVLSRYEMAPNLPAWIPEGFVPSRVFDASDEQMTSVIAIFLAGDREFSLEIVVYGATVIGHDLHLEKDQRILVEAYTSGQKTFYIMENLERLSCVWYEEPYELSITGLLSIDEMKAMIDSLQ